MKPLLSLIFLFITIFIFKDLHAQKTKVYGYVTEKETGEALPYVRVNFQRSKIGVFADSLGYYEIETYYATDSLVFESFGYERIVKPVQLDVSQEINCVLGTESINMNEVTILPPDEFPSTILHKNIIANKHINNREKLSAYQYELYNKMQFDINNLGEEFENK